MAQSSIGYGNSGTYIGSDGLSLVSLNAQNFLKWNGASLEISGDTVIGSKTITETLSSYSTTTQTAEALSAMVSKTDLDGILSNYSTVKQTADDITFTFTRLKQDLQNLDGGTQSQFNEITRHIRFNQGDIELGEVNNPIKLILKNNRISFTQNGLEVAHITNNILYITDGHFLNSLRIGNFAFTPRNNGSLSFGKMV